MGSNDTSVAKYTALSTQYTFYVTVYTMKMFIVHVTIILFIHNDDIHSHAPDTPWGHYLLHSIPSMAAHNYVK